MLNYAKNRLDEAEELRIRVAALDKEADAISKIKEAIKVLMLTPTPYEK